MSAAAADAGEAVVENEISFVSDDTKFRIIDLVRSKKYIWDTNDSDYVNSQKKRRAFNEMAQLEDLDGITGLFLLYIFLMFAGFFLFFRLFCFLCSLCYKRCSQLEMDVLLYVPLNFIAHVSWKDAPQSTVATIQGGSIKCNRYKRPRPLRPHCKPLPPLYLLNFKT